MQKKFVNFRTVIVLVVSLLTFSRGAARGDFQQAGGCATDFQGGSPHYSHFSREHHV